MLKEHYSSSVFHLHWVGRLTKDWRNDQNETSRAWDTDFKSQAPNKLDPTFPIRQLSSIFHYVVHVCMHVVEGCLTVNHEILNHSWATHAPTYTVILNCITLLKVSTCHFCLYPRAFFFFFLIKSSILLSQPAGINFFSTHLTFFHFPNNSSRGQKKVHAAFERAFCQNWDFNNGPICS